MTIIPTPRRPLPLMPLQSRNPLPYERFRDAYPDFIATIRENERYRKRVLTVLGASATRERHAMVRQVLRDRRLHLVYAYHTIRRMGQLGTATPASINALAIGCNVFVPTRGERVVTREVVKGSGRRLVQDFGPRRRMHQALVADVLRQLHPLPKSQTLFNGGMPMAQAAIATAYRQAQMTHGVEVDLIGFYGSIKPRRLAEYLRPLPTSVVEYVVWDTPMRDDPSVHAVVGIMPAPTSSPPAGLSLGSATSPIVGELIINLLLASANEQDTITYADNLFVMGRTEQEVNARIDRIKEGVASLEVGALELRVGYSAGHDLAQPFEFLKHEGVADDRRFIWRPGQAKRMQHQVGGSEYPLTDEAIAATERRVRHWRRSYPGWPEGDIEEAVHLAELAVRRFYRNGDPSNRTAAVHAVIIAWLAEGNARTLIEYIPVHDAVPGQRYDELVTELARWQQAASGEPVAA